MNDYKKIQFDLSKAKTPDNPNGLEVITKDGRNVRIICTDKLGEYPVVALVCFYNGLEYAHFYTLGGIVSFNDNALDLVLKEPIKSRRMTNQELSKWLREKPEEFREVTNMHNLIGSIHSYFEEYKNLEVGPDLLIRSNYGEWKEPLVEI